MLHQGGEWQHIHRLLIGPCSCKERPCVPPPHQNGLVVFVQNVHATTRAS